MHLLQANAAVDINRPLFRAFPPVLSFRGYEVGKVLEATLCLRNDDQASPAAALRLPQDCISIEELSKFSMKVESNMWPPP